MNKKVMGIIILAIIIIFIIIISIGKNEQKEEKTGYLNKEEQMTIHEGIPDLMYTGKNIPSKINESYWEDESESEEWIEIELTYAGEVQGELQGEYNIYFPTIELEGGFWYLITGEDAAKKEWLGIEDWGVEVDYAQKNLVVSLGREIEHLYYKQDVIIHWSYYETKAVFNKEQLLDNTIHVYIIDRLPIKDMGAGG